MAPSTLLTAVLAIASLASAQCGAGTPDVRVTGSGSSFTATRASGGTVYTGSDYRAAIQGALDAISSGQRVSVIASGSIGASSISIGAGKTLEGCGTINVGNAAGKGSIQAINVADVKIPYLTMTGNPYFGLRFSGTTNLVLGQITMNLSGGLGIRFDRDANPNKNVVMDTIRVTGAGSHAVETWKIDGLKIGSVIAKNVGECGLLLQETTNARVGLVDGNNVAAGNGYATFRMANRNGRRGDSYATNVYIDKVVSRGGGRGIFCVSESGGAEIAAIDLASNGNNAILIENCYNINIKSGTINGGGEVRIAARTEFANNKDITITAKIDGTSIRESPCATNMKWNVSGNPTKRTIC